MAWTLGGLRRARSRTISTSEEEKVDQAQTRKAVNADRVCAICLDLAQTPFKTQCCGKLFCNEHLCDWLNGSSNRCPSCAACRHPDAGIISLVSPASPTSFYQTTSYRDDNSNTTTRRASSRSRSSSSSSNTSSDSSCSTIQSTDSDDNRDYSLVGASFVSMESLSYLRKVVGSIIQDFLDESPSSDIPPSISLASYGQLDSRAAHSSAPPDIYPSQSSLNDTTTRSLRPTAMEEEAVIAGRAAGKVLSIVALMLVFWVLTN